MFNASQLRKIQKVGYSTLTISIPIQYAKELELQEGDSMVVREEGDGTLRLIPTTKANRTTRASIRADAVDTEELLSRLIISCYMLGYDTIEVVSKSGMSSSFTERASKTLRSLRGVELVEVSDAKIVAQSFMDPTKFPVDSLIKRLRLLVSGSLDDAVRALRTGNPGLLNAAARSQEETDQLYWLIVRQLLVAFKSKELSGRMGLESPLHTSGDRVSAKAIEEMGVVVLQMTSEIVNMREGGIKVEEKFLKKVEALAKKTQLCFDATMDGLLTPDTQLISRASALVSETLEVQRGLMLDAVGVEGDPYVRVIVGYMGQLTRYCNIVTEIALNRLLRKTSKVCVIQEQ